MAVAVAVADDTQKLRFGRFDAAAIGAGLPAASDNALEQRMLVDGSSGVRVFRVYRSVPRHLHRRSDTRLYVLSGTAVVQIADEEPFTAAAGDVMFWHRNVYHAVLEFGAELFTVLAFDTPPRDPEDVHFAVTKPERVVE